jgi:hypothetical protein
MHHVLRSAPVVMPTGTVTLLFTDIVGSTRLWEQDATDTAELVARHDAVVRGAIDAHGGVVFATLGDGFAAAFRRASDAVAAVILAQRTLVGGEGVALLVPVRMGLHTGEAVEVDADYRGPASTAQHASWPPVTVARSWWRRRPPGGCVQHHHRVRPVSHQPPGSAPEPAPRQSAGLAERPNRYRRSPMARSIWSGTISCGHTNNFPLQS